MHAINPKQLDRLRDRFSIAGAKDDRRDAYVSADGLRTDRHLFRRLQIADPRLIELRAWSRLAEELQEERVRLSNRLHQQLWRYYPQMLKLTDDLTATWLLELWLRAPTPAKAARLRVSADITEGGPNRNRRTEALSRGGTGSSNPLPSASESFSVVKREATQLGGPRFRRGLPCKRDARRDGLTMTRRPLALFL